MNLIYISNNRIPTPRAHGIHIAKMCEALARAGCAVTLLLPRRRNDITQDAYSYYGVERSFAIKRLPVLDLVGWVPGAFAIETFTFGVGLWCYLFARGEPAAVYVRGEMALFLALLMPRRHRLFWETHIKLSDMSRYRRVIARAAGIVVVTKYYRDELVALGAEPTRVLVAPDAVDLDMFAVKTSKEDARAALNLLPQEKLAVYCGSDLPWKGLDTLKLATHHLPAGYRAVFVGDIKPGQALPAHSLFAGQRPVQEIPLWLRAADVVVLTGTAKAEASRHYTSPLKMFEYMASVRPMVASDVPSFRDVLDENTALLVPPDEPEALAKSIVEAVEQKDASAARAAAAFELAKRYTWGGRAEEILAFIHRTGI